MPPVRADERVGVNLFNQYAVVLDYMGDLFSKAGVGKKIRLTLTDSGTTHCQKHQGLTVRWVYTGWNNGASLLKNAVTL